MTFARRNNRLMQTLTTTTTMMCICIMCHLGYLSYQFNCCIVCVVLIEECNFLYSLSGNKVFASVEAGRSLGAALAAMPLLRQLE